VPDPTSVFAQDAMIEADGQDPQVDHGYGRRSR
jgi:hypothetical protein